MYMNQYSCLCLSESYKLYIGIVIEFYSKQGSSRLSRTKGKRVFYSSVQVTLETRSLSLRLNYSAFDIHFE